jgi:hypothetical protein
MNAWTIGAIGAIALTLGGCETMNGPEAVANADAQRGECKVVGITSATQIQRSEHPRDVDRSDVRQEEGALEANRLGLNEPKGIRKAGSPNDSSMARLSRNC